MLPNTIQYNTIQYNAIQYNTIQYNTIQYNTIQYNTIQYNTIRTALKADCQSVKRQPQHASHCQWQSVTAAFVLFFANGTNIVANWVKKRHKVKEDSSNIFKIANIGKHWQKEAQLRNRKSGTNFTMF